MNKNRKCHARLRTVFTITNGIFLLFSIHHREPFQGNTWLKYSFSFFLFRMTELKKHPHHMHLSKQKQQREKCRKRHEITLPNI